MYPATVAITLRRTGSQRPGAAVGAMTSFGDLGIMAAGPLSGAIAAAIGYPTAFVTATMIVLLSLPIIVILLRPRPTRTEPDTAVDQSVSSSTHS